MTSGKRPPLCYWCKHLHLRKHVMAQDTCNAFREGIPDEIFDPDGFIYDHRQPYPGDRGIQFELLNDFEALKSREVFRNFSSMENLLRLLNKVLEAQDNINAQRKIYEEQQKAAGQDGTGD